MSGIWNKLILAVVLVLMSINRGFASADEVQVNIGWKYRDFTPQINLYDLEKKKKVRLWTTASVKSFKEVPAAGKIDGSTINVKKGERKKILLVAENNSDKPIYFFAAPHIVQPAEASLGFKFKCLCINHAFSIGARETWYRVVELRISKGITGSTINVTHTIVGIDKEKMEQFRIRSKMPDF